MQTLSLRAALKQGTLLVAANWPVVLIDFVVASLYRFALSVPVFGGSLVVATLVGSDVRQVIGDVRSTADLVIGSLAFSPAALSAFLAAIAVVGIGGEAVASIVKCGTFSTIVSADKAAGEVHRLPIGTEALERARAYSLEAVLDGARRFGWRGVVLALWLGTGYVLVGAAYVAIVSVGLDGGLASGWLPVSPAVIFGATTLAIVAVAAARLGFDLLRVIVIADDCPVAEAFRRLGRFVVADARQVIGIFAVMGGVEVLAVLVSLVAAAGLAIAGYVPLVNLIFVPLQAAAWVIRGIGFEALSLAALAAYETQYRRFSEAAAAPCP